MPCLNKLLLIILLTIWSATVAGQRQTAYDTSAYSALHDIDSTDNENGQSLAATDTTSGFLDERPSHYVQPRNADTPSAGAWNSLTSDKDLGYKQAREFEAKQVQPDLKPPTIPWWLRAINSFFYFFASTAGQILLWTMLALIVGYIVYRLVSGNGGFFARRDTSLSKSDDDGGELSEEDLLESDWESKLRSASLAGDYRLAIRYGYLLLLQLLQRRELIVYRQDKTNMDYYRDLTRTQEGLKPDFRKLTRAYEWAWYSGQVPGQEHAADYLEDFNRLKGSL